jgi:type I restriction enzyme R subunit
MPLNESDTRAKLIDPALHARIHITTYQTLDVAKEDGTANCLSKHDPSDYSSHIINDECPRSAWGKWSEVLRRTPNAVQIGLTATPRTLELTEKTSEALADAEINADKLRHFADTGAALSLAGARERYGAFDLEDRLLLPERVAAMCAEMFRRLCENGNPDWDGECLKDDKR